MRIANFFPGRFNPPTKKHQEIITNMLSYDGDSYVFIVNGEKSSKNKINNPLSYSERYDIFKSYYGNSLKIDYCSNVFECLDILYLKGYSKIRIFCGEDRYNNYLTMINNYYSNLYTIVCQERSEDDISATKIRESIRNNMDSEICNLHDMNDQLKQLVIERIKDGSTNIVN